MKVITRKTTAIISTFALGAGLFMFSAFSPKADDIIPVKLTNNCNSRSLVKVDSGTGMVEFGLEPKGVKEQKVKVGTDILVNGRSVKKIVLRDHSQTIKLCPTMP